MQAHVFHSALLFVSYNENVIKKNECYKGLFVFEKEDSYLSFFKLPFMM